MNVSVRKIFHQIILMIRVTLQTMDPLVCLGTLRKTTAKKMVSILEKTGVLEIMNGVTFQKIASTELKLYFSLIQNMRMS